VTTTTEVPAATAAGYPILKAAFISGDWVQVDGWIVLCDISSSGSYHPYVVWWMKDSDYTTHNGTYCMTLEEALVNWEARS